MVQSRTVGKKVALVAPTDRSIWSFRRGLIERLVRDGAEVTVICTDGPWRYRIESLGARFIPIRMGRFIDPFGDLRYLIALYMILRRGRFDLVHTFTIKPNVFGALAARLAHVRTVVALIEGFGFLYGSGTRIRDDLRRWLFFRLYAFGFRLCDRVCFINEDDKAEMLAANAVRLEQVVFIRSVGVDIEEYAPTHVGPVAFAELRASLGLQPDDKIVLFVSRMSWPKGVRETVEAAQLVAKTIPKVRFLLVGEIQPGSPESVDAEFLRSSGGPNVRWLGFREDVRELMSLSDIVIQPSYYREGVPRTILEALALGKPVVATDWVGCREAVRHKWNGLLVPIRDATALANAVEELLSDPDMLAGYGRNSRQWAEEEFDERKIVTRVLAELYQFT